MSRRIVHIGVAVEDLGPACEFFQDMLGVPCSPKENFGELEFSFQELGEASLEFLQSTTPEGNIAKFINKRGQGIHHIAIAVDDIHAELARLKSLGIPLINQEPYKNAHDELVAFIHPKATYGVLIEFVQENEDH